MPGISTLRPPKAKTKKSMMPLNIKHEVLFGLKVASRDARTSAVTACMCRFCSHVSHGHHSRHLTLAHPLKWEEYQRPATNEEREAFFTVDVPYSETMRAHFDPVSTELTISLSSSIVDGVVNGLLFQPDEIGSAAHQRAMVMFVPMDDGNYQVVIKAAKRFMVLIGTVALGASFRMAARVVQLVRDETGLSVYTGCTDALVSNYTRIVCASALQQLSNLLRNTTGFSLALDTSTLHSLSYLDVRVRFVLKGTMKNFHLMATPMYGSHTGKIMCDALVKLLTAVCPRWRDTLVGVSTDGEAKMTGSVRGLVTRIEKETSTQKVIRIWCGLHQLDLVLLRVYKAAFWESFVPTLTAGIGHLRRQQLLIAHMKSTCPNVAETRWLSMEACASWLTKHIVVVQQHYNAKSLPHQSAPDRTWWIFRFAVHALAREASVVFTRLQGLTTVLSQQQAILVGLVDTVARLTGMEGPLSADYMSQLTEDERMSMEVCDGYALSHTSTEAFLVELDTGIESGLASMPADDKVRLLAAVARLFVTTAVGIMAIVAERDSANLPTESVLPVLPHQLVQMSMPSFNRLLNKHRPRLDAVLDAASIHEIGQEHTNPKIYAPLE